MTTHITFENDLSINNFMITQIRTTDISNTLPSIVSQQEDITTVNGGTVCTITYSDNSKDLVVYNPVQNNETVQGITCDAKVWLLHADYSGNWVNGSVYGASAIPVFSGFSPEPSVIQYGGINGMGVQYEITF